MPSNRGKNTLIWYVYTIPKNEINPYGLKNKERRFLLLLMVSLFQTNPRTENNYKMWTVCMCVYMYKHLYFEGISASKAART